jgi:outer membrane lipoprotein-sorting protein
VRSIVALVVAGSALRADSLPDILKRMDASSKKFEAVSAKIKHITYTAVLNDSSEESGEMRLKKTTKGLVGTVQFSPPDDRTYSFNGGEVRIYYPKTNIAEIYDMGKYKKSVDSALALGFGTSGADLQREYEIKVIGPDTVQSTPATHLQLTPKSAEVLKLVPQIELWIQNGSSNPVQVKQVQPSKDYSMFIYSDVKLNPQLPASAYELKLPKGVREHHPGKD